MLLGLETVERTREMSRKEKPEHNCDECNPFSHITSERLYPVNE